MKAPLLLLHGYPFNHEMWSLVRKELPTSIDTIAPDLPGLGKPVPAGQEPSLEFMADAVKGELEGRKVSEVILAGFSMGGYVSLAFAEKYPGMVKGLILVNSQAATDSEEARQGRRKMIETIQAKGIAPALEAALKKLFAPDKPVSEDLAAFATKAAERAGPAGLTFSLEAMARRPDRTSTLIHFAGPVLIIHSAGDQFIPAERARSLGPQLKNATYVEIPNAGHATPLEAPQTVARAMKDFMERLP